MGEYEDRYPEAYGHGEVIEDNATERHLTETGLPRQPRATRRCPRLNTPKRHPCGSLIRSQRHARCPAPGAEIGDVSCGS